MNAFPILLLGGAALMMMGGKKKPTNGVDDVDDDEIVIQTVFRQTDTILKKPIKKMMFRKATLLPKTGGGGGGGGGVPEETMTPLEEATARLCSIMPDEEREAQAKLYVSIALKGIRKAHDGTKSKKKLFPCNDKERLSWTVDEAFRLWVDGNPEATTTAKRWVYVNKLKHGELTPSTKAKKHRPWNTMNSQEAEMSLTALSYQNGMRYVTDLHLNECASYIRNLLTEIAGKKCGKKISGIKKIFPWNW